MNQQQMEKLLNLISDASYQIQYSTYVLRTATDNLERIQCKIDSMCDDMPDEEDNNSNQRNYN